MSNILDINDTKKAYTFYFRNENKEKYFCKCGGNFEVDTPEEIENINEDFAGDEYLIEAINSAQISIRDNIKCPHCNTDYKIPQNQKKLIKVGKDFMSGYNIDRSKERLTLNIIKVNSFFFFISINSGNFSWVL